MSKFYAYYLFSLYKYYLSFRHILNLKKIKTTDCSKNLISFDKWLSLMMNEIMLHEPIYVRLITRKRILIRVVVNL